MCKKCQENNCGFKLLSDNTKIENVRRLSEHFISKTKDKITGNNTNTEIKLRNTLSCFLIEETHG
jgi:ArsR family metal-binding transcriptional regulator